MIRNVIGAVLALVGAAAAVWSPFRVWYDGRQGRYYEVDDLFTGITAERADLWWSLLLPLAFAALLTVIGLLLRSRLTVAAAGVVVLGFTVLWMVRQGQAADGLSAGADDGLGWGVALALGGGVLLLLAAAVMAGRPRRRRVAPAGPADEHGYGEPHHRTTPATAGRTTTRATGSRTTRATAGGTTRATGSRTTPAPGPGTHGPTAPGTTPSPVPTAPSTRATPSSPDRPNRRTPRAATGRRATDPGTVHDAARRGRGGRPRGPYGTTAGLRPRRCGRAGPGRTAAPAAVAVRRAARGARTDAVRVRLRLAGGGARPVAVPFTASSAYTQRSLLHAYTTPARATGEPVISPPVVSFQRSWPPAASSVYSTWSRSRSAAGRRRPPGRRRSRRPPRTATSGCPSPRPACTARCRWPRGCCRPRRAPARWTGGPPWRSATGPAGRRVQRVHRAEVVRQVHTAARHRRARHEHGSGEEDGGRLEVPADAAGHDVHGQHPRPGGHVHIAVVRRGHPHRHAAAGRRVADRVRPALTARTGVQGPQPCVLPHVHGVAVHGGPRLGGLEVGLGPGQLPQLGAVGRLPRLDAAAPGCPSRRCPGRRPARTSRRPSGPATARPRPARPARTGWGRRWRGYVPDATVMDRPRPGS